MANEGYDVEVVQDIPTDFNCVICLKLMRNPVQFKCGHGMCCTCFKCLCKKTKQRAGMLQCPQCRERIKESQVFPNTMLQRLILQLKVRCTNAEFGCMWIDNLDNLEDHLKTCDPVSDSANGTCILRKRSKSTSQPSSPTIDPLLHSDLLLSINDQLSTLERKLDSMSATKDDTVQATSNQKKDNNATQQDKKQKAKKQKPSWKKTDTDQTPTIWERTKTINYDYYFLPLICPIIIIFILGNYLLFTGEPSDGGKLGHAISSSGIKDVNGGVFSRSVINPSSTLMYQDKLDFDHRAITHIDGIAGLVLIFIKMEFGRMKVLQKDILKEIPSFEINIKNKLIILEKTFSEYFEISWREISGNITEYDEKSMKISLIDNITSLHSMFVNSANYLNNAINNGLVEAEQHDLEDCRKFCDNMKEKFENLLHRIHMFSEYDFSDNIYKDELFRIQREFASLKANITKTSNDLHVDVYEKKVRDEYNGLRGKYQSVLNSYYANVTYAISYEVRFRSVMGAIQNRDSTNGNYVWQINTSKMSSLPKDRAFVSELFTSVHPNKATLLLYRDRQNKGHWKLTFHHEEYLDRNIGISVLNQVNESQLICIESLVGESKKDDSAKVKKFFNIPMSNSEMKQKGFIRESIMYVRCSIA